MNKKFCVTNSVFHLHNENDEEVLSTVAFKQAQKTGRLNLSNRLLVRWPAEIFKLGVVHSDNNEIDMNEDKCDNFKWWELEPLKYLDMSSNNLKEIPADIKELDSLLTLLLQQNVLEALPPELGQLRCLVKLDLAHNKISEFPSSLSELKELKSLNLSNNLFKHFPETVFDLVMLNKLDISKNIIEDMTPGIGFLTRLDSLNLSQNKLRAIPPDLANCKALKDLNLSSNQITSEGLPELCDMNIEVIQLHYNKLSYLPKLKGCSNLKEIHLGYNDIEEITMEELSTLSHARVINLRNNKLIKIPKELSYLQNLICLDLSYNDLKELPPALGLLPHLESLLIEGNGLRAIRRDILHGGTSRLLAYLKQQLTKEDTEKNNVVELPCAAEQEFPDRYAMRCSKAVSLSSRALCNIPDSVFEEAVAVPCNMVDLSKNKLQRVPDGLWLLSRSLNDLNLSQNQLKDIPVEIGACLNLRYLNVAGNKLTSLPEEFAGCKRMKELNISLNKFIEIPSCIYDLDALEILIMSDNKIVSINAEKFLRMKRLTRLDLTNNDLTNVPPLMGKMTQLQSFGLNGNALKAPRPAIIAKGTEAILAWLRDKIE